MGTGCQMTLVHNWGSAVPSSTAQNTQMYNKATGLTNGVGEGNLLDLFLLTSIAFSKRQGYVMGKPPHQQFSID